MIFILKPSLEHMALVKIGISLWNQNDVTALISKLCPSDLYPSEKWETIEESVIKKVPHLLLPQPLKEKVLGVIKPIGVEILMWRKYNYKCLNVNLPYDLCWTPQGTIDKKQTAELLVEDDNLDVFTRYKLACEYCLEDDILRLWNREYLRGLPERIEESDSGEFSLIFFWSFSMKRGGTSHIAYKDAFYFSVFENNEVAAKYFLQKLTPQERKESLEDFSDYIQDANQNADVFFFLLPDMEEEEQTEVLKIFPIDVLNNFLQWPWQNFFIGIANSMREFLSKESYEELLVDITVKVRDGYKDYNYKKLFRDFWHQSPRALKDSLIEEIDNSWLLQSLWDIKDKENIRLILKNASSMEKETLVYSDEMVDYFVRSVCANEWDFLEFIIRECLPSKAKMLKFKEEFENYWFYTTEHLEKNKDKWSEIFSFPDDSLCKFNKRCVEESESSSSKRFQSLQ